MAISGRFTRLANEPISSCEHQNSTYWRLYKDNNDNKHGENMYIKCKPIQ